ncbi:MAG: hypothetical protein HKN09_02250 [Saprospiraceae bacterium]|nr:hypothetical protein [Saprospiraceae bacterium]
MKSLNKSEKRLFKLYVNRLSSNEDGLFLQLFSILDKATALDDLKFQQKLGLKSKNQYSNIKRHLYAQIVKSLRLSNLNKHSTINLREQMDYASILYTKGLYEQSLLLLERIKPQSLEGNFMLMYLQILELQKKIESRHITRSRKVKNRIESIVKESQDTRNTISKTSALSDLSLNIQGLYIKHGFARNTKDEDMCKIYFESNAPVFRKEEASFYESVLWHQSNVWYHYMCLNFKQSLSHARQWVEQFDEEKRMLDYDPDLYMRGMHYALTNSFYIGAKDQFNDLMLQYRNFRDKYSAGFAQNSSIIDFIYFNNAVLNECIINNNYQKTDAIKTELLEQLKTFSSMLDHHRVTMFNYKIAMIHLYEGRYSDALDLLNKVISTQEDPLRPDVLCYSRLLHLLCHFGLNNFDLLPGLLISVRNSFINNNIYTQSLEAMFVFLRKAIKAMNFGINDDIKDLQDKWHKLFQSKYEELPLIYFDFENWLRSQSYNFSIEKTIALSKRH